MKRRNRKRSSKAANARKIPSDAEKLASSPTIPGNAENPAGRSATLAGAERRTHPRYEFTAAVEVVAAESGTRMETRVRDLSRQGCYVDTDNARPLGTVTLRYP